MRGVAAPGDEFIGALLDRYHPRRSATDRAWCKKLIDQGSEAVDASTLNDWEQTTGFHSFRKATSIACSTFNFSPAADSA